MANSEIKHDVLESTNLIDDENQQKVVINVDRMKTAVNSERFQGPENASRETIREFIISVGSKNTP